MNIGNFRKWSEAEDALLRSLWANGIPQCAIARELRVDIKTVSRRAAVLSLGPHLNISGDPKHSWTKAEDDRIWAMHKSGMGGKEIAAVIGLTKAPINARLRNIRERQPATRPSQVVPVAPNVETERTLDSLPPHHPVMAGVIAEILSPEWRATRLAT